jgi:hypothetical protein
LSGKEEKLLKLINKSMLTVVNAEENMKLETVPLSESSAINAKARIIFLKCAKPEEIRKYML